MITIMTIVYNEKIMKSISILPAFPVLMGALFVLGPPNSIQ